MEKLEINVESKVNEIFSTVKVTHKIFNDKDNPIELEVYIHKDLDNFIFSYFYAKIGDSTEVHSKVMKKEKAEEKYTDSISSGNAAIYVTYDQNNKNIIIVHLGNIPPKQELIFISEYIQFTEVNNNIYEFDVFKNIPLIKNKDETVFYFDKINGYAEITTQNKIKNVNVKFISNKLNEKEKDFNENKNVFWIKYEYLDYEQYIKNKNNIDLDNYDDSKINKIFFELESNNDIKLYSQISNNKNKEKSYILNYNLFKNIDKDEIKLNPGLFYVLVDNRYKDINVQEDISNSIINLLQSIPKGSYYKIFGFDIDNSLLDVKPKEYNQENIDKSISKIYNFEFDIMSTSLNNPYFDINQIININNILDLILSSEDEYKNYLLPKNIFIITEGNIKYKSEFLNLIEKLSNDFTFYLIGIGKHLNKEFISNAGYCGKGYLSLSDNLQDLNHLIVHDINYANNSDFINNFNIKSTLDEISLYNINENCYSNKEMCYNKFYKFFYITEHKENKEKNIFTMKYKENSKDYIKKYEITEIIELPPGEELSKLIIYKYILTNDKLSEEEKIKLALKYQILIEGTSLFAQIELQGKILEQLINITKTNDNNPPDYEHSGSIIINDNNSVNLPNISQTNPEHNEDIAKVFEEIINKNNIAQGNSINPSLNPPNNSQSNPEQNEDIDKLFDEITNENNFAQGDSINPSANPSNNPQYNPYSDEEPIPSSTLGMSLPLPYDSPLDNNNDNQTDNLKYVAKDIKLNCVYRYPFNIELESLNTKKEKEKLNMKEKEKLMEIIRSQNFIEGFWNINNKTEGVKKKYEKEFNLIKQLKEKNMDDIIAMTIIIIYFINKECLAFNDELIVIIKKAKYYIMKKIGDSYENIIKKAGIQ